MDEYPTLMVLLEFLNACEAGIANAKRMIRETMGSEEDFDELVWETREGAKGKYEQTSKSVNNNALLFETLQHKLIEYGGFWQNNSYRYWTHNQDADVIDRRKA